MIMQIFPGRQIVLTRVEDVEISTVELPRLPGDDRVLYETCIFPDDGLSDVVARYDSETAAARGHADIVAKIQQPKG